ncbi:MAG: hypothetical protein R3E68_20035 [Burkholderiaceae bacterium]
MLALLLPLAFVIYPLRKSQVDHVPCSTRCWRWLPGITTYFAIKGNEILMIGWGVRRPPACQIPGLRAVGAGPGSLSARAGGNAIFAICLLISIYPIFSSRARLSVWREHQCRGDRRLSHVWHREHAGFP